MTGLARIPLGLLDRAAERGLDRDELMRAAGLHPSELTDPDARVSVTKIWTLWRAVIDGVGDATLGLHLGQETRVRDFGLLGYAIYHSRTLREAFDRLARYSRIVNEALVIHVLDEGDRTSLVVDRSPRLDALRHPADCRLASIVSMAREITGAHVLPLEVRLPYRRPESTADHQRFFGAPVLFDQPESTLAFARRDVEREVVHADETLSGYLDRLADEVLASLGQDTTFRQRVRRAIWSELSGGKPSVRQIAGGLAVSPRTLQRRLEEEGTSFAAELDSLRQEMATRLLQNRRMAIYEVAFLLGYSEPSTFYRAFRRWKKVSPHEFRQSAN